jgi:hypothetical protein
MHRSGTCSVSRRLDLISRLPVHIYYISFSVPVHNQTQRKPSCLHSSIDPASMHSSVAPPVSPIVQPVMLSLQGSPVYSKLKQQPPSPPHTGIRYSSQTPSKSHSRSATLRSSPPQTREPSSQPPVGDPLGPSAQYPYLPESPKDGGVHFSCRPGGPRIFDLLNTLSLAPFGLSSWFIVDRQEELFELNDVLDEDKVVQALWSRWILLKRQVS